ncbi:hypothetical protein ED28_08710 [[Pantoea] beijingensis]|uniref:Fimbrial assembly protein n=1 Tax=[Pantoea] beijingensis TaxID=1324864 RepID=A0A443IEG4_9GAMM|nr:MULTISPECIES: PilN domain-containing protein [Erwiniaceae]RWR02453.1 hypothetical protein ED28_08710 [[Pantoea] beijingensis]
MIWVNFLPWRQRRRQRALYQWLMRALTPLLFGISLSIAIGWQLSEENYRWRERIARQEEAITQAGVLSAYLAQSLQEQRQLQVVQQKRLQQRQRNRGWHQFSQQLAQLMPETLWLTTIKKREEGVRIVGFCQQLADVREFRQQLGTLSLFQQVENQGVIRQAPGQLQFILLAKEVLDG